MSPSNTTPAKDLKRKRELDADADVAAGVNETDKPNIFKKQATNAEKKRQNALASNHMSDCHASPLRVINRKGGVRKGPRPSVSTL
jgi:hypothetical protein